VEHEAAWAARISTSVSLPRMTNLASATRSLFAIASARSRYAFSPPLSGRGNSLLEVDRVDPVERHELAMSMIFDASPSTALSSRP